MYHLMSYLNFEQYHRAPSHAGKFYEHLASRFTKWDGWELSKGHLVSNTMLILSLTYLRLIGRYVSLLFEFLIATVSHGPRRRQECGSQFLFYSFLMISWNIFKKGLLYLFSLFELNDENTFYPNLYYTATCLGMCCLTNHSIWSLYFVPQIEIYKEKMARAILYRDCSSDYEQELHYIAV